MAKNIHRYYDPELIFGLLADENWKELFSFIGQNAQIIDSDPITKNAIDTCEDMFFLQMEKTQDEAKLLTNLETFYLFHKENSRRKRI
jgi:hypothetical protein